MLAVMVSPLLISDTGKTAVCDKIIEETELLIHSGTKY